LGCRDALEKLGAGAIEYAPTHPSETRSEDPMSMQKRDLLWKEFDDTPFQTGEESGLGQPSAPAKCGSDDYGLSRLEMGQGGQDANQGLPQHGLISASAIQGAFDANRKYDEGYAPEPPTTNPHGGEKTADNPFAGSAGLGMSNMIPPSLKPPNPMRGAGTGPKTLSGVKMPTPFKAPQVQDATVGLGMPPGNAAQQGLKQQAQPAGALASMAAPNTRMMGNPL